MTARAPIVVYINMILRLALRVLAAACLLWLGLFVYFTEPWRLPPSLAEAVCSGNVVGAMRRLSMGDDVNGKTAGFAFQGIPLFLYFAESRCPTFSRLPMWYVLKGHGAQMSAKTDSGYTLLMLATEEGNAANVGSLLEAGLNPDALDAEGKTALMLAAGLGDRQIVNLFLEHGADEWIRSQSGDTAADIERKSGKLRWTDRPVYLSVLELIVAVFSNRYFIHEDYCVAGLCGQIVSESKMSIDSEVIKYFYADNSDMNWPIFNKNYVMFRDGGDLCIQSYSNGVFTLLGVPDANNIPNVVKVDPRRNAEAECGLNFY